MPSLDPEGQSKQVPEPVQIIKVFSSRTDDPEFLYDNFESIVNHESSKGLPFFIVSVSGDPRSGKSFLLNLMVTHLQHLEENPSGDDWETSDLEIKGGRWAMSSRTVTHGIWMWNQPFVIEVGDRKVAVLLVDCGSAENGQGDPDLDLLILYLSFQLCNVQILNVRTVLKSTDLDKIWTCVDYSDYASDSDVASIPHSLVFVMRNWDADDELGERDQMFSETMRKTGSDEMRRCCEVIDGAFEHKTCFVLPHPGMRTTRSSDTGMESGISGLTLSAVDHDFIKTAKELLMSLFSNKYPSRVSEVPLASLPDSRKVMENFKAVEERVRTHKLDSMTRSGILESKNIHMAYNTAREFYEQRIKRLLKDPAVRTTEALQRGIDSVVTETIEQFERNPSFSTYRLSSVKRRYSDQLAGICEEVYNNKLYKQRHDQISTEGNRSLASMCVSKLQTFVVNNPKFTIVLSLIVGSLLAYHTL